jgi:c-di-GMP-binding flagellar brake protein YcgR
MSALPPDPGRKRRSDRRFARISTSLPGVLLGRAPREVEVLDLSRGGCLVRSPGGLEPGAIADVRLALGAFELEAKVRVREASVDGEAGEGRVYLLGLEFMGLSARAEEGLRAFLESESRRRQSGARPAS